jgi:flagellin-like protein
MKLYGFLLNSKNKLTGLLRDEKGEVNVIAIVLLIVVAVVLIVLFQSQITGLLGGLFNTVSSKAAQISDGGARQ